MTLPFLLSGLSFGLSNKGSIFVVSSALFAAIVVSSTGVSATGATVTSSGVSATGSAVTSSGVSVTGSAVSSTGVSATGSAVSSTGVSATGSAVSSSGTSFAGTTTGIGSSSFVSKIILLLFFNSSTLVPHPGQVVWPSSIVKPHILHFIFF